MRKLKHVMTVLVVFSTFQLVNAQDDREFPNFREPDKTGINQFEAPKEDVGDDELDGVKVRVGGGLAIQFQGLSHENAANNLARINNNFNLPTANLDLDVLLAKGLRMHLRTYLSSRHHSEAWVKGGYLQIDNLDFINEGLLSDLMDNVRIKVGHMEINYGDTHFRRSDNGSALYNPFVGNYLLDAFTTEVGGEIYYFGDNGLLAMVGMTNGRLNQDVLNLATKPAVVAKLGFDNNDDQLRLRLTGSIYHVLSTTNTTWLYQGDRAGSRYYKVLQLADATSDDFRSGRINPGMTSELTSIMINPFIKAGGLEFFGVAEFIAGRNNTADAAFEGNRNWTHLAAELVYRFGSEEQLYIGGRYNVASGQLPGEETNEVSIDRLNIGGGWFLTDNVVTKLEYVVQNYNDYPAAGNPAVTKFNEAQFNGFMVEAVISF